MPSPALSRMSSGFWRSLIPLLGFVSFWIFILGVLTPLLYEVVFPSPSTNATLASITSTTIASHSTSTISGSKVTAITKTHVIISRSTSTEQSKPPRIPDVPVYTDPKAGLLAAAATGSWKDTLYFLELGVKPSVKDSDLRTPLHLAARNGDNDTIALLLKHKNTGWFADGNVTPLHLAARYGNTAAVKQITSIGGHDWPRERATAPQAMRKLQKRMGNKFDKRFETFFERKTFSARELAVIYGHEAAALAFPTARNDDLLHALSCACMHGDMNMVETLWYQDANRPWLKRHNNRHKPVRWFPAPPLHLAVMSGNRATVAFFLERGLKANDKSSRSVLGWFTSALPPYSSPAHYAAIVGPAELLLALERRKADLTAMDHKSRTPLSYAVESLNEDAVELLVKRKHRSRGGIFISSEVAISRTYFGKGHIWPNGTSGLSGISSSRIQTALKDVGFVR